ncbi:MAG: DNA gyrase inhibitor YacG [Candidatus Brocadiia bacterium]
MCAEELKVDCPNCGRTVVRSPDSPARFFPFCSKRCKMLDLAKWFDEEHRIEEPRGERLPDRDRGEGES